jgi:ferredoxin
MATIFCFSSTGNSLYAAKKLAEKIGGQVRPMNNGAIESADDVIGFVFPVYFWGLPRMVERFVTGLQITNKAAYVFAVATSGGPVFGVLGRLKELLRTKGVNLSYGRRLVILSNYIPKYTIHDSAALRRKTDDKILEIAGAINKRSKNKVRAYTFLNRKGYNVYPSENSDRYFTISPACTGCATCQKACPAHNITMEGGKPVFRHKCEHCLACLHNCPASAIDWQQKTQGKERYRHAGVSLDELLSFSAGEECEF